jgi:hypothetical protein
VMDHGPCRANPYESTQRQSPGGLLQFFTTREKLPNYLPSS